jgi:hypothetical protein
MEVYTASQAGSKGQYINIKLISNTPGLCNNSTSRVTRDIEQPTSGRFWNFTQYNMTRLMSSVDRCTMYERRSRCFFKDTGKIQVGTGKSVFRNISQNIGKYRPRFKFIIRKKNFKFKQICEYW